MPYWEGTILASLKTWDNILVVAHGNTLRGIIKYLKHIPDEKPPFPEPAHSHSVRIRI